MSLESKKQLVKEIALHLHMEFWTIDHDAIIANVEKNIRSNLPKGTPSAVGERMQKELNSWYKKCAKEVTTDTTVVAMTSTGDILVTANPKKRTEQGIRKGGKGGGNNAAPDPAEFGFYDRRHEAAIQRMTETFPATEAVNIINLVPAVRPQTPQENAALHAEMQILRYAEQEDLDIVVIGISKPACAKCAAVLDRKQVRRVENVWDEDKPSIPAPGPSTSQGTGKRVTNWVYPSAKSGFPRIMRRARIQHMFEVLKPGVKGEQVVEWQVGKETPDFWVRPIRDKYAGTCTYLT
jgi:hypothetical protein